jgi:hypothetical protein
MVCNAPSSPLGLFVGIPLYVSGAIAFVASSYLFYRMNQPYSIIPYFASILCFQGVWIASFVGIYASGFLLIKTLNLFIPPSKTSKDKKSSD